MHPERALRCRLTGRVQGVYYRASTHQRAAELGLQGWVRNLPDGQVEVVVAGGAAAVGELTAWLWDGPPAARVDSVTIEEWRGPVPADFSIR